MLAALGQAGGVGGGFGPATHAELGQQVGHVVLYRFFGQIEHVGDLPVGLSIGDEVQNSPFLPGETGQARVTPRTFVQTLQHLVGQLRIEKKTAATR